MTARLEESPSRVSTVSAGASRQRRRQAHSLWRADPRAAAWATGGTIGSMGSDDPPRQESRHLAFLLPGPRGSTIRTVLVLGFVVIFGLWFLSTYALVQRV